MRIPKTWAAAPLAVLFADVTNAWAANDNFELHPNSGTAPYSASATALPTASLFFTSGMVPAPRDATAPAGSPERFGDTYTQAPPALERYRANLAAQGLSLDDVLYARAYVVRDGNKGDAFAWNGWNRAFPEFFPGLGTGHKPARTSIGIDCLGNADFLIEIELVAAFPDDVGPQLSSASSPGKPERQIVALNFMCMR